jgi:pyrimidine operon attenuation protein / uracil phosphoribosyltransferase
MADCARVDEAARPLRRARRSPAAPSGASCSVVVALPDPLTRSREARKDAALSEKVVLNHEEMRRILVRMAHEVVEKTGGRDVAVVGIHRRGAVLGRRLRDEVAELVDAEVPLGDVDINFYRDDLSIRGTNSQPVVNASHIDFPIDAYTVVLVDDVLYTGRTVRAGIEALFDYGRPRRVQLAVLADRGHRELPFRPDYVGKNLPTARSERVEVRVEELDGVDEVAIVQYLPHDLESIEVVDEAAGS